MLATPNSVTQLKSYYISYNFRDVAIYGCPTTALVDNNMTKFYILNGDHRQAYANCTTFDDCKAYFLANQALRNKYSDKL